MRGTKDVVIAQREEGLFGNGREGGGEGREWIRRSSRDDGYQGVPTERMDEWRRVDEGKED